MKLIRLALPLMFGTGLGQLITLFITPLLTRNYSTADFGGWGLFVLISSMVIVGSAFRYDISILLPSSRRDVLRLSVLSIRHVLVTTTVSGIVFILLYFIEQDSFNWSYMLLPLSVFLGGSNLVLTANLNYLKSYKKMAFANLIQTLMTLTLNVIFCFTDLVSSSGGELIIATVLGQFIYMLVQLRFLKIGFRELNFIFLQKYSLRLTKRYFDFAVYSLPACYISSLTTGLPVYSLKFLFTEDLLGQYVLANRVLLVPLAIVGAALSHVFIKYFSDQTNEGFNILGSIFKIWGGSLAVFFIPAAVLFFYGEVIILFIFGQNWTITGQLVSFLIVPILFNFCLNLTASSHVILRMQNLSLYFGVAALLGKLLATYLLSDSYFELLLTYVLVETVSIVLINITVVHKLWKHA